MERSEDYMRKALAAEAHAMGQPEGSTRQSFLKIARQWRRLAKQAGHPNAFPDEQAKP